MNRKALIVDDSPAEIANLKSILSDAGCMVVTASSGQEAVEKAKTEKPGIIFLDIVMPDMDGYEACRILSADPVTKGIPVVFVTSKGQKADKVWGQMQGAKGHIAKPYSPDQITDQLKALS
jgi:twitching motility two-component system response regulator PilH